jgi:hypothetical protein
MSYKPFEEYSDKSFDQSKFMEASTTAKLKRYGVAAYNETVEHGVPVVKAVSMGAIGGSIGGSLAGGTVAAGDFVASIAVSGQMNPTITMSATAIGAVAMAAPVIVDEYTRSKASGHKMQATDTQAELSDDIGEYNDRFLRASIVSSRASRAKESLGEEPMEISDNLQNSLEDDREGIRTSIEEYAAQTAIAMNEKGMESEEVLSQASQDYVDLHSDLKEISDNSFNVASANEYMELAESNAMDYYAQMQVGEAMLEAEKQGITLSDDELNTLGESGVKEVSSFMKSQKFQEAVRDKRALILKEQDITADDLSLDDQEYELMDFHGS